MVTSLQDSSRHQVGAAAAELQEAEKTMENNLASKDGRFTPSWHEMPATLASLCHLPRLPPGITAAFKLCTGRQPLSLSTPVTPAKGRALLQGTNIALAPLSGQRPRRGLGAQLALPMSLSELQQELARVNGKVQALQDELGVLRAYMDKEYPAKAIQIDQLLRDIQSLKEEQQVRGRLLPDQGLGSKVPSCSHAFLGSVWGAPSSPAAGLPHAILQVIAELQEDIVELQRSIQRLRGDLRDPREVIFADVLLRRPRCLPDEEVVLSVPQEEEEDVAF
uniref:Uncharacterized protein n=1 Tax=Crocodylus porosus TaxID=8502 RepID=A0A7M4ELL0_CROPO